MNNSENSGILIYAQLNRNNYIHTVFMNFLQRPKSYPEN